RELDLGQVPVGGLDVLGAAEQPLDHRGDHRLLDAEQQRSAGVRRDDAVERRLRDLVQRRRPGLLVDVDHLERDRGAELGRQLRGRGTAEPFVATAEPPLLVLGELRRTREVHLTDAFRPARACLRLRLGDLAAAGRLDERRDLVVRQNLAHGPSPKSSCSTPPASFDTTRQPSTCTRTVRPLVPEVALATTLMRRPASCASVASAFRAPMSSDEPPNANMRAPPTSTASSRAGAAPSDTTLSMSAGTAMSANLQRLAASGVPVDS